MSQLRMPLRQVARFPGSRRITTVGALGLLSAVLFEVYTEPIQGTVILRSKATKDLRLYFACRRNDFSRAHMHNASGIHL